MVDVAALAVAGEARLMRRRPISEAPDRLPAADEVALQLQMRQAPARLRLPVVRPAVARVPDRQEASALGHHGPPVPGPTATPSSA